MDAPPELELTALQHWMLAVVTAEDGVVAGAAGERARAAAGGAPLAIKHVLHDLPDLRADESVAVYAGMYFERLIGAITEDYPAVRDFLGPAEWRALARRFVAAHPSTCRSLNDYGGELYEFVRDAAPNGAFLAELARLERSIRTAQRAPDLGVLDVDELLAVPQAEWAERPLPLAPSIVLHAFAYPVERVYRAWRRDERPELPRPEPSFVVCWRSSTGVWRRELTREQHALLSALADGRALGAAIESVCELDGADVEALGSGLQDWFREWCREGFFRAQPG